MATFGGSQVFNMTSTSDLTSLMKEETVSVDMTLKKGDNSVGVGFKDSNKNTNTTSKGDS